MVEHDLSERKHIRLNKIPPWRLWRSQLGDVQAKKIRL